MCKCLPAVERHEGKLELDRSAVLFDRLPRALENLELVALDVDLQVDGLALLGDPKIIQARRLHELALRVRVPGFQLSLQPEWQQRARHRFGRDVKRLRPAVVRERELVTRPRGVSGGALHELVVWRALRLKRLDPAGKPSFARCRGPGAIVGTDINEDVDPAAAEDLDPA